MSSIFAALLYLLTGFIPTAFAYWLVGLIVLIAARLILRRPLAGVARLAWRYTWPLAALWTFYDFYSHVLR